MSIQVTSCRKNSMFFNSPMSFTKSTVQSVSPILRKNVAELSPADICLLARHSMSEAPWNSVEIATKAQTLLISFKDTNMEQNLENILIDDIRKGFSTLSRVNESRKIGGLRPQLGLSDKVYDSRQNWRSDPQQYTVVSTLYFMVKFVCKDENDLRKFWNVYISSILKVMDDVDGVMKKCGCLVLDQVLNKISSSSTDNRKNYLTASGLDKVLLDTMKVALTYLPPMVKISETLLLLPTAFNTAIMLLTKCAASHNDEINELSQLLISEIVVRYSTVKMMEQHQRMEVVQVYIVVCDKVINRLKDINTQAPTVVLRRLLWGFLLNILSDEYILTGWGSDKVVESTMLQVLRFTKKLISVTSSAAQRYKFDILAAMIMFCQAYENEKTRLKIQELEAATSEIDFLIEHVLGSVTGDCTEEELGEIVKTKRFMARYFEKVIC